MTSFSVYQAVLIAEGEIEATEEQQIEAWQFLIDNGTVWRLQGFFGRRALQLIKDGVCHST